MPRSTAGLVLVLGAISAITPASIDMYLPAFPALGRSLGASAAAVQFTLGAYLIGLGVGQAIFGPVADRFGRRGPLAFGLVLYAVASAGCALAPRIETLIVFRVVQALGGSACLVIPRAIVRDRFDPEASARVFSMLMLVLGVAPILAPVLGGWIAAVADWRAIFWVLAGFGVAGCALTMLALPGTAGPGRAPGATALGDYARVLSDRRYLGFAIGGGVAMAGLFAYISASPFVLIELYGLTPQQYSWVFGFNAAGLIASSQVNRWLLRHFPSERVLSGTLIGAAAIGVLLLGATLTGAGGLPALVVLLFAFLSALGLVQPNAVACALADHPQRAASASALYGVLQFGSAAVASALVGAMYDGTARPMAAIMMAAALAALAAYRGLARRARPPGF